MLDVINNKAVKFDVTASDFDDFTKYNGQQPEVYTTVVAKLTLRQSTDLQTVSSQTESHVCIIDKVGSRYEFRNIDFNPTKMQSGSSSLPDTTCVNQAQFMAYQYNPAYAYDSSSPTIHRLVCAISLSQRFSSIPGSPAVSAATAVIAVMDQHVHLMVHVLLV